MFNTIRISGGGITHAKTEIHEHRAPTDKSVAILSEMEQVVRGKLLSVNRLINNTLEATWYIFDEPMAWDLRGVLHFKLNGREFKIDVPLERHLCSADQARRMAEKLIQLISVELTRQLFDAPRMQTLLLR
jgi:hypothetical protein